MAEETTGARFHRLRRALHGASLQLEVARVLDDASPTPGVQDALARVRDALSRASVEVEGLEREVDP